MNVGVSANVRFSDILFHYHLDLESFWNLLKFFIIKAQIREPTHISRLRAKTPESHMFLFFNYQVHSLEEKSGWYKGDSGCLGPAVPEAETHASKTGEVVLSEHTSVLIAEGPSSHHWHSSLHQWPPCPKFYTVRACLPIFILLQHVQGMSQIYFY